MIDQLLGKESALLARGVSLTFVLRVTGAFVALAATVVITRLLGPSEAGIYFLAVTFVRIGATVGKRGLENTIIRHLSARLEARDLGGVNAVHRYALRKGLLSSVGISVLIAGLAYTYSRLFGYSQAAQVSVLVSALGVVPVALLDLYAQSLRAIGRIVPHVLVIAVIQPLILVIIAAAALLTEPSALYMVAAFCISSYATAALGLWFWRNSRPEEFRSATEVDEEQVSATSRPLFVVSLLELIIIWIPNLLLGAFRPPSDLALFEVAKKAVMLIYFLLLAVGTVVAPMFSRYFERGDRQGLERVSRRSSLFLFVSGTVLFVIYAAFPDRLLAVFGEGFSGGAWVLIVMAFAQLVNVSAGPVEYLLMMTGNERPISIIYAASAATSLLSTLSLVPSLGALGAAVGFTASIIVRNAAATAFAWTDLRIRTFPGFSA